MTNGFDAVCRRSGGYDGDGNDDQDIDMFYCCFLIVSKRKCLYPGNDHCLKISWNKLS